MTTRTRRFSRSPNNGGYLARPRAYNCVVCGEKFQRDALNSVPMADRVCPDCKRTHKLIPLKDMVMAYALPDGLIYHLRDDCPLLAGKFEGYEHLRAKEARAKKLEPCVLCAYANFDPRQPYKNQPNPSGLTKTDWDVIKHQGRYLREDGVYRSDVEQRDYEDEKEEA